MRACVRACVRGFCSPLQLPVRCLSLTPFVWVLPYASPLQSLIMTREEAVWYVCVCVHMLGSSGHQSSRCVVVYSTIIEQMMHRGNSLCSAAALTLTLDLPTVCERDRSEKCPRSIERMQCMSSSKRPLGLLPARAYWSRTPPSKVDGVPHNLIEPCNVGCGAAVLLSRAGTTFCTRIFNLLVRQFFSSKCVSCCWPLFVGTGQFWFLYRGTVLILLSQ